MKRMFIVFLVFVSLSLSCKKDADIQNPDIYYYFNKSEIEFLRKDKNRIHPESEIYLYMNKSKNKYILSSMDRYPFGIMNIGESEVYIDLDGDNKIDGKFEYVYIPYWIIRKNSSSFGRTQNILETLDFYFDVYKSNEGYLSENNSSIIGKEMVNALSHTAYDNRDLYYLLFVISASSVENQEWCLYSLELLDTEIKKRFKLNFTHPVIYIYLIETLIKLNEKEMAKKYLDLIIESEPENPVYKFYEYKLEKDPEKAKSLLLNLRAKYKDHWLVKQLR